MIEFITKYQIPLIIFGILIIMALIGYEAEQREAIKRGDKKQKENKKKNKKERLVEVSEAIADEKASEPIVDVNTEINEKVFAIDDNIQEQSSDVNEEYAQTEEPVEESFNSAEEHYVETYGTTEENYGQDVVDNAYSVESMENSTDESNDFVNNMNQFANDMGMPEMESHATDNKEGYENQETNIFEQEYSEVSNYEQINTPTYEEQTYQSENANVQSTNVDDSLQAFMEPSTPTDANDSFGVNDMSIFESPQAPLSEEQSNNMQEWKL